jgi:hypothetical protein
MKGRDVNVGIEVKEVTLDERRCRKGGRGWGCAVKSCMV